MKNLILLFIFLILIILITNCSDSSTDPASLEEIRIGALIPFSGSFGQQGESVLKAMQLAVEDANKELEPQNKKIILIYDDTETDANTTRVLLNSYMNQGIRIIVGPMTSAELTAVKDTLQNSNSIVISQSSTAVELAIENDNIFRVIPDDSQMAKAIADKIWNDGIEKLLVINRDDLWGNALVSDMGSRFEDKGGTVVNSMSYFSHRQSVYMETLDEISIKLENELTTTDSDKIALQITTFDEGITIMETANENDYPFLKRIKWYGSEGITLNRYMLESNEAVQLAREINFSSPMFEVVESAAYNELQSRLSNELGYEAGAFAILAYDALRAAAITLADIGEDVPIETLRSALFTTLNGYEGVTGTINLNAAGDRSEGTYTFWQISESGTPEWVKR